MDAHDELFYRLNDPDPKVSTWAELELIGRIFGANFVERWLEWNGFEDELRGVASVSLRRSCSWWPAERGSRCQ